MRCLLISPLRPADPLSGDVVYTERLLSSPPTGVEYTDYLSAQREGNLSLQYSPHAYIEALRLGRIEPLSGWPPMLAHKSLSVMRRWATGKFLLHEDWKILQVQGSFDVIHIHCFPVRLRRPHPPVVLSDSIGNYYYLRDGRKWPERNIQRAYRFESWLLRRFSVYHTTLNLQDAAKIILFSDFGREFYLDRGVSPDKITIIPPGIANTRRHAVEHGSRVNIGFIATDPRFKGGDLLIAAFTEVHKRVPDARLLIVGGDPRSFGLPFPSGAEYLGNLPHEAILAEFLPNLDIYALPSALDGYSITVIEAMSQGLPLLTTDRILTTKGILEDGVNGFAVPAGNVQILAEKLEILCRDAELRARMREECYRMFLANYHVDVTNSRLRDVYAEAVESSLQGGLNHQRVSGMERAR